MSDTVQQVKDKLSIVDVVSQYVKLERAGVNMKAKCPFHSERTASFIVSPDRGTYHCFGCNVGGDIFTFIQEVEGVDFKSALKMLADKAGVQVVYTKGSGEKKDAKERLYLLLETATVFFQGNLGDMHPAHKYLKDRGLEDNTIQTFRIGFAPDEWRATTEHLRAKGFSDAEMEKAGLVKKGEKGAYDRFRSRIMFPIADSTGRIVAFSGRIFEMGQKKKDDDFEPAKYINSPDSALFHKSKILYGYDRAKQHMRKLGFAILVEGQMDLVMSHQAGWGNTVAVSGTSLTPEHVTLIKRMADNIVVALDADDAGIKAATKSAWSSMSSGMTVKVAALPEGKDPADIVKDAGADAWKELIRDSKHIVTFLLDALEPQAKDNMAYRTLVKGTVLPFVKAASDPMQKDALIREVAGRTGASETSVADTLSSISDGAFEVAEQDVKNIGTNAPKVLNPRLTQLYGLILWQESLTESAVSIKDLKKRIFESISAEEKSRLDGLPEDKAEAMRFDAEKFYSDSDALSREVEELITLIERDHLRGKIADATERVRRLETSGDDAAADKVHQELHRLSEQLKH